MAKVSVIMPALNVVKYIRPCIESVISQTLKDLEIIIIDAGSTDGTLEILQEYACKDRRIKIIHSDKKSYGYQINLGIGIATGDYIGIVETDDIVCIDAYQILYHTAQKENVEYVKGRFEKFVDIHDDISWSNPMGSPLLCEDKMECVISPCNMPELFLRDIYVWTGIYKREFITEIKLNETAGAAYQDIGFLFQTISLAQRAVYLDKIVYRYRQDNGDSSTFNRNGFKYLVGEYTYVEKFLNNKGQPWKSVYYQRMLDQTIARFKYMAVLGRFWKETEDDINSLRKQLMAACNNNFLTPSELGEERENRFRLLLQNSEDIYLKCLDEFSEKKNRIEEIFELIKNQEVVIFGSGRYGKFFHALLISKYAVGDVVFCDNNSTLWNTTIQGTKVISPQETIEQFPKAVYVVANSRNVNVIKEQLKGLGIADEKVFVYNEEPSILLFHD